MIGWTSKEHRLMLKERASRDEQIGAHSRQGNAASGHASLFQFPPSPLLPNTTTRPRSPLSEQRLCSVVAFPPSSSCSRGSGMGSLSPTATRGKAGATFSSFSPTPLCPPPRWLFGTNLQTPSTHSMTSLVSRESWSWSWCWSLRCCYYCCWWCCCCFCSRCLFARFLCVGGRKCVRRWCLIAFFLQNVVGDRVFFPPSSNTPHQHGTSRGTVPPGIGRRSLHNMDRNMRHC